MDKEDKGNPLNEWEVDKWQVRSHLFSIWPGTCSGGRGEQILRKGRVFRERKSNFSLDFPVFGPSVLVGLSSKVVLRCKGYAWAPVLWSFDNSGR